MQQRFNLNGELFDHGRPIFGPEHRAYRYGDALFESMRCIDGRIPLLDYHFDRLTYGMTSLGLTFSAGWDNVRLKEEITRTIPWPNARIRLQLSRGGGGKYGPETDEAEVFIHATRMAEGPYPIPVNSLVVGLFPGRHLNGKSQLSRHKHANALPYILAARYAHQHGWDDALLLNTDGRIAEASASNIFLWKDGRLLTPSLSEGPVAGVMRRVVMTLARQAGLEVVESSIDEVDLSDADEIWLTNAVQGVRTVGRFELNVYQSNLAFRIHDALIRHCDAAAEK